MGVNLQTGCIREIEKSEMGADVVLLNSCGGFKITHAVEMVYGLII